MSSELSHTAPSAIVRREFLSALAVAPAAALALGESAFAKETKSNSKSDLPTALVCDEICKTHEPGLEEPECPGRYDAVLGALTKSDYFASLRRFDLRPAAERELRLVHTEGYVALARR